MTRTSRARVDRLIEQLIRSAKFNSWQAERVESGGYARPGSDDRDRFDRCYDAAEDGADGSTHAEAIADMREYCADYVQRSTPTFGTRDRLLAAIDAHFDDLELWHKQNGSLHAQIG